LNNKKRLKPFIIRSAIFNIQLEKEHTMAKSKKKRDKKQKPVKETKSAKMSYEKYVEELEKLEVELVKLQGWIRRKGLKVVVIFEGRDAAGKGGVIKRITRRLSPRVVRVVALQAPTEKEKTQFYFQRYVKQLPSGGEMVLFDRSWYNRAVVEPVRIQATCPVAIQPGAGDVSLTRTSRN
jgi:polyphosphate kinase 2 (PPK2 family)